MTSGRFERLKKNNLQEFEQELLPDFSVPVEVFSALFLEDFERFDEYFLSFAKLMFQIGHPGFQCGGP